jgi:uncharacterized protein (TIGR02145 family)
MSLWCLFFCFNACQKDSIDDNTNISEVFEILEFTETTFINNAALVDGNPRKALASTFSEVERHEAVAEVELIDSAYLLIVTKSGLRTSFQYDQKDDEGYSKYRGAGSIGGQLARFSSGTECTDVIANKKVLLFAAVTNEFYKPGQLDAVVSRINSGSNNYDIVVLKDEQCTPNAVKTFGNYGMVIINTHGNPDGFMTGLSVSFPATGIPQDEASLKSAIRQQLGENVLNDLLAGKLYWGQKLNVRNQPDWYIDEISSEKKYKIFIHSTFLNDVPELSNSVILGNMCYSGYGFSVPNSVIKLPIRTAFMSRNPISYYCYAFANNKATFVDNDFAKEMEDTLIRRLLLDIDSTGIANLKSDNVNEFQDLRISNAFGSDIKSYFKQFGPKTYCFGCGAGRITDNRDGKEYNTVCIGDQVWMAENLDYNAANSVCYENSNNNCIIYGRLYDWPTLMNGESASFEEPSGVRGICPLGWHLPSLFEWRKLINNLGGSALAGELLRDSLYWDAPTNASTNSSGFSAKPGGYEITDVFFEGLGITSSFWSTSVPGGENPYFFSIDAQASFNVGEFVNAPTTRMSCRCVKDN